MNQNLISTFLKCFTTSNVFGCVLFSLTTVFALDVANVQGRVDHQDPVSQAWVSVKAESFRENEFVRLQRSAELTLQEPGLGTIDMRGPAHTRINRLPSAIVGLYDLTFTEMQGLFRIDFAKNKSNTHFQCGSMVLNSLRGKGRILCAQDSALLLVWMDSGQVTAQRGADYGITLESGRIWRLRWVDGRQEESFVDSAWAQSFLRQWIGVPKQAEQGTPRIFLQWSERIAEPIGTHWRMGEFLGKRIRSISGVTSETSQRDSLEWRLTANIERFNIAIAEGFWTIDLKVVCNLENRWTPFESHELVFEKKWNINDQSPNRYPLLKLLPLDSSNTRIQASVFGSIANEFQQFIEIQVMDPFKRAGIEVGAENRKSLRE